jgi:[ribosomal protein S18]-alanine N-acetyltransferase
MSVVRRGSVEDLVAIMAIERGCGEVAHWSEAAWRSALEGEGNRVVLVAENERIVVGFVVVGEVGGVVEMEAVAVMVGARGEGIGRGLCGRAVEWAEGRGAGAMQLEVRASNAAALRMYGVMEFVEQGRRRRYYRDPVDDAVLMEKRLRKV